MTRRSSETASENHSGEAISETVPYAYAATAPPHARTVFLAGACPLDVDGHVVAPGDFIEQTSACIENMERALAAAGATVHDVVFVRALVASAVQTDLAKVWAVVHNHFGKRTPPSTLMGVTVLGWPNQLVEIEAVAALVD
ncbi:MAG TPA: RidA family protein [Amnibacterium sp.]|jgi:enamine deaminase RidA (YjgF/YER057c/UK114 family)|uniref:RidA family protein n=1 Tax=Amnibacterium sp. TaxID=1872496 RepID=UPI002F93202E